MWRIYEFICKYNCNFITGLVNVQWFRMNVYDFLLFTALQVEIDWRHCSFYHFFTCHFLVCKPVPWSNFFSLCMVIDLVICRHLKFTFPNLCRKDMMDIIEYNWSRKKTRRPRHFTYFQKSETKCCNEIA